MSTEALYTPNTTAFGHPSSLPILSARDADLDVVVLALAADAAQSVPVPSAAQAVEFDALNSGQSPVTLWLMATAAQVTDPAAQAALARAGLRRVVPPGAQLVEVRAVRGGDALVMVASGALDVRVAYLLAGDAS